MRIQRFGVLAAGLVLAAGSIGCQPKEEPATTTPPLRADTAEAAADEVALKPTAGVPDPAATEASAPQAAVDAAATDGSASDSSGNQPPPTEPAETSEPAPQAPAIAPLGEALPAYEIPLWKPSVVLSAAHEATCLVRVDDHFPPLEVETLTGEQVSLEQRLDEAFAAGNRLAVVVLWRAADVYGREQFERLDEELSEPLAKAGVKVFAIHVGGNPDDVTQLPLQPGPAVDVLIDPGSEAFAKLATDKLPRTYLLNADRQVLWFDMEYSRGTRRDLSNALMYHLKQMATGA